MRRIEIDKYNCPRCNAQLAIVSEDYMVNSSLTTRYKCQGCRDEFYSVEYLYPIEKEPEFDCPYCNQKAHYLALKGSWLDYWRCIPCKCTFEQSFTSEKITLTAIYMYTDVRGNLYVLRQFPAINKSRIELLPENLEDTVVIAQEFDFLLPSVTPANIQEKLLTYLIFS